MIRLQRTILVRTFEAEATVAVGRDRPEFLAVARLAADLGHPIGGRDISRELLGNLPEQVGWRVLDRALALGLLEREGLRGPASLSESGRAMLEQGAVLVPEEGVWRFYLVDDPLVAAPLLHVQRLDADHAKAERDRLYKRGRGERPESGQRPPRLLTNTIRQLLRSVSEGKGFELRDLGERGEEGPRGELTLLLTWAPGKDVQVALRGRLPSGDGGDKPRSVDAPLVVPSVLDALTYEEAWALLVSRATQVREDVLYAWMDRAGTPVLPTRMGDWPDGVRRSFMADLKVPQFQVDDLGPFDATRLEGVPLVADSDPAAQEWAEWLLWDRIATYVVPSDIEGLRREVAGRFPLHRPRLPDADALLRRAKSEPQDRTSRFLLAPADLGLWS